MRDGDYLVVGLRRSGLASCEAIHRLWPGASVRGFDSGTGLDTARLDAIGVEYVTGQDEVPVAGLTALIKSPGVPGEAPVVRAARAAGVPVWGEVELAHRMLSNPFVGVTGTNGKTTTTELIGAMLRAGGLPVEVAGNIGRALTELPGRIDPDAWVVAELSSFQLEDIDTFHAEVAVVLNITPDHIDRHGSLDAYLRAKLRLLENQRPEDVAVLNADDPILRAGDLPGRGRREWFSRDQSDRIDWQHAGIRGQHNLENALAAALAAEAIGVSLADRDRALRDFTPPPHRLEVVATRDGVSFVNDSKATNPEAAMMALTAFDDGIRLILGGSLKGASFAELAEAVADGPVAGVYLIGQAAGAIATELDERGVAHTDSGDLTTAIAQAAADASPGDTVLLSPACASFDQFRDYEHRGDEFRRLAGEVPVGV